jgi:hypothetical protein
VGLVLFWRGEEIPLRDAAEIVARLHSVDDTPAEGAPVRVTGAILTSDDDRVADPNYVWPAPFGRLDRVIEGVTEDSDGDEHWESVASCDEFTAAGFQAQAVRIGALHASLEQAAFLGSKPIPVDAEGARVEHRENSTAVFEPAFGGFYVAPRYPTMPSHLLKRGGAAKDVSCVLSYRGVRSGETATVVGVRRGNEIVPWERQPGVPARLWVIPGESTPQDVATILVDDARPPGTKYAHWKYAVVVLLGWLVLFVPPLPLFLGFCSCGVMWLENDLPGLAKTLAMAGSGALALFGTLVLVNSTQHLVALIIWIAMIVSIAGWVRFRLGWDDDWSWFDFL